MRNRPFSLPKFLVLALVVGSHLGLAAQSTTSLRGRITDASGAVIAQASVSLIQTTTGSVREGKSNTEGFYEFPLLQPGTYDLKVSASGFNAAERKGLELLVSVPATINLELGVAGVEQQIEVTVNAPLVNTSDASLGAAFNENQVSQLPIEARNVVQLLSLQPGVTFLGDRVNAFTDTRSGSVNGARSDQSNVTLDGVDVNDQNNGFAFSSVLRVTQDSVQEFRITTSNANADSGRSSGAQVTLVTKGGTNEFHGSAYEYHRNTIFSANDPFLKASQIESGQPNKRAPLLRNVFGASLGGPFKKNRLFFFANYEGRRDRESASIIRNVPSADLRQGFLNYIAEDGSTVRLTPDDLRAMDPKGIGVSSAVLDILQGYPMLNEALGDNLNFGGYRFAAKEARKFDTYIAKVDWTITRNGHHTVFWRGNLQNDSSGGAPQFPGQPAANTGLDFSKGFATNYTALLGQGLVNSFRWGYTRQSSGAAGISMAPVVNFPGVLDSPVAYTRSGNVILPVHNLVDDISWTKGKHTLQFGGNIRLITDSRSSFENSFSSASMNAGWLGPGSGIANTGSAFDPPENRFPAVDEGFQQTYDDSLLTVAGIVTEGDAIYNYDRTGTPLALGSPVRRSYAIREYEMYGQDSWKITPNFTLNYGVRWTLLAPPYETSGTQVGPCTIQGSGCEPLDLANWFNRSAQEGASGGAAINAGEISFAPSGPVNGRPGFWNWDYKNFGPRVAVAWSPDAGDGWLRRIFGRKGDLSLRGGYALVYDHFGVGIANTFDKAGSFGLTSQVSNPPGTVSVATAPRFVGINDIPSGLLPAAPPGGFPATPDPSGFAITWGLDSNLKTPYSHVVDFAWSRQLSQDTLLEVAYVGRFARRLPVQHDLAMPLNLVDPASKTDYFTAATQLSKMGNAGVNPQDVAPIPYWEHMFPALAGTDVGFGTNTTATQVAYSIFANNLNNETFALFELDTPDEVSGAGFNVPGHSYQPYRYYHDQVSSLYAWRTIGESSYNALQVSLRRRFSHGLQGDFNYTLSKSLDWTSAAERLGVAGNVNHAQIINTWVPDQLRGISDFDATHQINANWIWELPFGKGQRFGSGAHGVLNALIGGWQLTGLFRWTSGYPFAVDEGGQWPTNWDIEGWATLDGKIPSAAAARGEGPNRFKDPAAVLAAFRSAYPGESGTRNPLRGDGYFGIDTGLGKSFPITEQVRAQLRWETFNVTNSVRYDVGSIRSILDEPDSFGTYRQTLTNPRVMQFALRLEF
jgi:hypothetical protein